MKTNGDDMANPMHIAANGQIFTNRDLNGGSSDYATGLTKREQFALAAMQGLSVGKITKDIMSGQCVDIATEAVEIADALIVALNKEV